MVFTVEMFFIQRLYQTTLIRNGVKSSDPHYSILDLSLDLQLRPAAGSNIIPGWVHHYYPTLDSPSLPNRGSTSTIQRWILASEDGPADKNNLHTNHDQKRNIFSIIYYLSFLFTLCILLPSIANHFATKSNTTLVRLQPLLYFHFEQDSRSPHTYSLYRLDVASNAMDNNDSIYSSNTDINLTNSVFLDLLRISLTTAPQSTLFF